MAITGNNLNAYYVFNLPTFSLTSDHIHIKLQDVIATPERPLLTDFPSPTDPHIYHEVHDLQAEAVQPIYRPIQAQLHFQVRKYSSNFLYESY